MVETRLDAKSGPLAWAGHSLVKYVRPFNIMSATSNNDNPCAPSKNSPPKFQTTTPPVLAATQQASRLHAQSTWRHAGTETQSSQTQLEKQRKDVLKSDRFEQDSSPSYNLPVDYYIPASFRFHPSITLHKTLQYLKRHQTPSPNPLIPSKKT
jgi:hypothetical protein